jgi:Cu(I)/Ag(I) efflux system periplasmic protein CusF
MNKTISIAVIALVATALPGCSKQAEPSPNASTEPLDNMTMSNEPKMGKATGTVTAIDPVAGKITLDHGPVAELQWPAMTMAFGAKPDMLKGVTVGDKVSFEFMMTGANAEIVVIKRQ